MIDAHIHLHDARYETDCDELIERFFAAGGEALVNIGTSVQESRDALVIAGKHEKIFSAVGLHPQVFNGGEERQAEWMQGIGADQKETERMEALKSAVGEIERMAENDKVVAIGEIGLDYFSHDDNEITFGQQKWQRTGFVVQIALAQKLELPVVVHCRPRDVVASDAYFDCVQIVADNPQTQFVMHCYMGNVAVTEEFLALENVTFSFTGNVTFSKNDGDQMSDVLRIIPLERMMIETDGPYLTPKPHRGKRNDPRYIKYVAQRIASLKNVSVDHVLQTTVFTTRKFFRI